MPKRRRYKGGNGSWAASQTLFRCSVVVDNEAAFLAAGQPDARCDASDARRIRLQGSSSMSADRTTFRSPAKVGLPSSIPSFRAGGASPDRRH